MSSHRKKPVTTGHHKLRIIGGSWRSRALTFPVVDGLRPTGDRIRETLFNWLAPILPGSRCLDLFAGSGILGFEALSRGAQACVFVELNRLAFEQLRKNADLLGTDKAHILPNNALAFLANPTPTPFDVVFVDPPFSGGLWEPVIEKLAEGWLSENAFIYIEAPPNQPLPIPADWLLHREKQAGDVVYRLFRRETNATTHV